MLENITYSAVSSLNLKLKQIMPASALQLLMRDSNETHRWDVNVSWEYIKCCQTVHFVDGETVWFVVSVVQSFCV